MKSQYMPLLLLLAVTACGGDSSADEASADAAAERQAAATAYASGSDRLTADELEAGRMQMSWREFVARDTTGAGADSTGSNSSSSQSGTPGTADNDETWDDISMESVNGGPIALPVGGDVQGPSVLRVQVLLDRAVFSPGAMDGKWGRNTEKAVYWLQESEGLEATGQVDERTWERLQQITSAPQQLVAEHSLTAEDVEGPFVTLPGEYYDRRDMDCQCYESLAEKLAEQFHTTRELLEQLNPGTDLNALSAGQTLKVPAIMNRNAPANASIVKLVISDGGGYLHAVDASGNVVYHFPATLGSDYSPSPSETLRITNIAQNPTWHYQPDILEGVDDDEPDAVLPPGPNNAVGVVWMALSKEHYGIHGTSAPETIGYATSNGCVRLTNWDARFLSERIEPGVTVEFRDVN